MENELKRQRTEWIEIQQREIERKIAPLPNPQQREQLREKEQKAYESRKEKFDASFEDARKIAQWKPYDQNAKADWFDPEWMFGVVNGFDVVTGNPPYISHDKIQNNLKPKSRIIISHTSPSQTYIVILLKRHWTYRVREVFLVSLPQIRT